MKKIITALALMIVLAGVAFAANNDTLYVTAQVAGNDPTFVIYGGLTEGVGSTAIKGDTTGTPTEDNTVVLSTFDPSVTGTTGVVYVKLVQSTIAKTVKTINLTITGSPLANTQTAVNGLADLRSFKTDNPVVGSVSAPEVVGINYLSDTPSANGNAINYQMRYTGTNVAAGTTIGISSFTWSAKDTLPVGNYQATITMTYTIN